MPERSEWQPMKTAPRDGTRILVDFGQIGVHAVSWTKPENASLEIWCVDDCKFGPFALRGYIEADVLGWMPLPRTDVVLPPAAPEQRIAELEARLASARKLQDLTLSNEIRWMQKHSGLLNKIASLRDWKSPDGVLQVKDLHWFKDLAHEMDAALPQTAPEAGGNQ